MSTRGSLVDSHKTTWLSSEIKREFKRGQCPLNQFSIECVFELPSLGLRFCREHTWMLDDVVCSLFVVLKLVLCFVSQ